MPRRKYNNPNGAGQKPKKINWTEFPQTKCAGCDIEYPNFIVSSIFSTDRGYGPPICPKCALWVMRQQVGPGFNFNGETNKSNLEIANEVAGDRWKAPEGRQL